jgi:hypothetical protein
VVVLEGLALEGGPKSFGRVVHDTFIVHFAVDGVFARMLCAGEFVEEIEPFVGNSLFLSLVSQTIRLGPRYFLA